MSEIINFGPPLIFKYKRYLVGRNQNCLSEALRILVSEYYRLL